MGKTARRLRNTKHRSKGRLRQLERPAWQPTRTGIQRNPSPAGQVPDDRIAARGPLPMTVEYSESSRRGNLDPSGFPVRRPLGRRTDPESPFNRSLPSPDLSVASALAPSPRAAADRPRSHSVAGEKAAKNGASPVRLGFGGGKPRNHRSQRGSGCKNGSEFGPSSGQGDRPVRRVGVVAPRP